MFREKATLDRDLQLTKEQFYSCAMYHNAFIDKEKLEVYDKVMLDRLAMLYQPYRDVTGLDKRVEAGKNIINPELDEWKKKTSFERYRELHSQRAFDLVRFTSALLKMNGIQIKGKSCIDVGCGSGAFFDMMNSKELETGSNNLWFGVDIPESRSAVAKGTDLDRNKNPLFREFHAGGELPFKNMRFGLATALFTLHHVENQHLDHTKPDNLIAQIYDKLEPGGHFLIMEDNIGGMQVDTFKKGFVKLHDEIFYPNSPGNQRTQHEWSMLLMQNGFETRMIHAEVDMYAPSGIMLNEIAIIARKPA